MTAMTASPTMALAKPPPVASSVTDTLGVFKFAKGLTYYPMQWLAGVAAVYILTGFVPPPERVARVATVRAVGVAANNTIGDGIKNGIPFDLGLKFDKTPTEHLYSLDLIKYGFQRLAYSASAATWSGLFAVTMTLAMPYAAPAFLALGQAVTSGGLLLGGLASAAAAHSTPLAMVYQVAEGAALLLGQVMQLWPAAFAMKEGVPLVTTITNTLHGVFMVNLVAGVLTDIVGLEKLNPNHRHKVARKEALAAAELAR
jgi:hypothetical protein